MDNPHFWIFADGSCGSGQNDVGAWTSVVVNPQHKKLLYGAAHPTTISRCELIPIIEGLRWIKNSARDTRGLRVRIYSDSEYTIKTLSGVYPQQKNEDLWIGVETLTKQFEMDYRYRERNSHPYMQVCDAMCSLLRKKVIAAATELMTNANTPELIVPDFTLPLESDEIMKGLANANTGDGGLPPRV